MAFVGGSLRLRRANLRVDGKRAIALRMSAKPVVLCPGQGAQYPGMGAAWVEKSSAAAKIFKTADAVLGDRLGAPLSEIILNGAKATIDRTDVAQPAIFVTSIACWEGMKELELVQPGAPALAAGLSLGEYTALTVAGALDFEDALQLVALRGLAMQDASEEVPSTMCALVGADEEKATQVVEHTLERSDKGEVLVAANYNAPGQVVISGTKAACNAAAEYAAQELKLRAVMLDVAGAFHSPIMAPAADRLADALAKTSVAAPLCPVMANVTGLPHTDDPEIIRGRLIEQLTNPTRWADCMAFLKDNPDVVGDGDWIELAPGKTLTGIMKKCDRRRKVAIFDSPPSSE